MQVRVTCNGEVFFENVTLDPDVLTVIGLRDMIGTAAKSRADHKMDVILVYAGRVLPLTTETLGTFGVSVDSTVHVVCKPLVVAPRLCGSEPLMGPISGGTPVCLHGEGFTQGQGFGSSNVCVAFGSRIVPCKRITDTTLSCVSPAHPAGVVTIRLLCRNQRTLEMQPLFGHEADGATFEFVRLETMYDAIFSTTNAFCPIRQRAADAIENENSIDPETESPRGSRDSARNMQNP